MPFDEWMTPPPIIELARKTMGSIDIDPASNHVAQEYVRALQYCVAPADVDSFNNQYHDHIMHFDGLVQNWNGNVWCNPPYSKKNIDAFVDKAVCEWNKGNTHKMLILVNSATDCKWYHKLLHASTAALLWRGRIKFWKIEKGKAWEKWISSTTGKLTNSPRYLNTLFYFDNSGDINSFVQHFGNKGTIVKVVS